MCNDKFKEVLSSVPLTTFVHGSEGGDKDMTLEHVPTLI